MSQSDVSNNYLRTSLISYMRDKSIRLSYFDSEERRRFNLDQGAAVDFISPFIVVGLEKITLFMGSDFADSLAAINIVKSPTNGAPLLTESNEQDSSKFAALSIMTAVLDSYSKLFGIPSVDDEVNVTEIPLERLAEEGDKLSELVFDLLVRKGDDLSVEFDEMYRDNQGAEVDFSRFSGTR